MSWRCTYKMPNLGACYQMPTEGDQLCSYHIKLRDGLLAPPLTPGEGKQVSVWSLRRGDRVTPQKELDKLRAKRALARGGVA